MVAGRWQTQITNGKVTDLTELRYGAPRPYFAQHRHQCLLSDTRGMLIALGSSAANISGLVVAWVRPDVRLGAVTQMHLVVSLLLCL
jgi:uncharacterized Zn-binding protein involved in type VI secretion